MRAMNDMPARSPLGRKLVSTLLARGLTGTATVVLTYYVSRTFGIASAGMVNLAWLVLLLVAMFARYGSEYSGLKHLAVHASRHDAASAEDFIGASTGVFLLLLACALPVALASGSRLFAPYGADSQDLLLFGLSLCLFGTLSFLAPLHRGLSRPDASYCFDQGGIAIVLLLLLAGAARPAHFVSDFLTALLTASAAVLLLSFLYFRHSYRRHFGGNLTLAPTLNVAALKDGLPYFLICISEYFLFWTGLLLLGALDMQTGAGVYAVLLRTAQLAVVAMGIINAIVSPTLAALYAARRTRRLRHYVGRVWKLNFLLGTLSLAVIWTLLPLALDISGIRPDRRIQLTFLLLMLPQVLKILLGPVSQIMAMSGGSQRRLAALAMISFVVALLASLALVPDYDMLGAAMAYCCGLSLYHLLCLLAIRSGHGFYSFEAGTRVLVKLFGKRSR